MKILIVADVPVWAIGKLSHGIRDHSRFKIDVIYCHPRDVRSGKRSAIQEFESRYREYDVIHFQYFELYHHFVNLFPDVVSKKIVLTHHNQKDLKRFDYSKADVIVCHTEHSQKELGKMYPDVRIIRHGIDLEEFRWRDSHERKEKFRVGFVGRVVRWKGFREVVEACHRNGWELLYMGRVDDPEYLKEIPEEYLECVNWSFKECSDIERAEAYRNMDVYVGNSGDGHEEGTLPYLEAMAVGVPVVTTLNGTAKDYAVDGKNCIVIPFGDNGSPSSVENVENGIKMIESDLEFGRKLADEAWNVVKNYPIERMSWEYEKLYFDVWSEGKESVSVIIPATYDRNENVGMIVERIMKMGMRNIEIVVVYDELIQNVCDFSGMDVPVRVFYTKKDGYNLALARNIGLIESFGDWVLFCDSRILPSEKSIAQFLEIANVERDERIWYFGNKGSGKNTFVENFSFVRRDLVIKGGMFNQMIDRYGGMSQELRSRFIFSGFKTRYIPEVMAEAMLTSKKNADRRSDIVKMKLRLLKMGL